MATWCYVNLYFFIKRRKREILWVRSDSNFRFLMTDKRLHLKTMIQFLCIFWRTFATLISPLLAFAVSFFCASFRAKKNKGQSFNNIIKTQYYPLETLLLILTSCLWLLPPIDLCCLDFGDSSWHLFSNILFALKTVKVLLFALAELGSRQDEEVTGDVSKCEVMRISSTEVLSPKRSYPNNRKLNKNYAILICY